MGEHKGNECQTQGAIKANTRRDESANQLDSPEQYRNPLPGSSYYSAEPGPLPSSPTGYAKLTNFSILIFYPKPILAKPRCLLVSTSCFIRFYYGSIIYLHLSYFPVKSGVHLRRLGFIWFTIFNSNVSPITTERST